VFQEALTTCVSRDPIPTSILALVQGWGLVVTAGAVAHSLQLQSRHCKQHSSNIRWNQDAIFKPCGDWSDLAAFKIPGGGVGFRVLILKAKPSTLCHTLPTFMFNYGAPLGGSSQAAVQGFRLLRANSLEGMCQAMGKGGLEGCVPWGWQ